MDDYVKSGSKICMLRANLRLMFGLNTSFEIMVSSNSKKDYGKDVNVFSPNFLLANWLDHKYHD